MALTNTTDNATNNKNSDANYLQISDEDLDECENLEDDCLLDESEVAHNANNGRGPYERAWTTEATRALIHIRGPMEGNFTEGRQKRTALWLHCTRQLQRMGFRYSAAKVQKKWHNILITYNKNLSKKYLSGYVHWEFFEEMFKYLQGKKADFDMQQQQPQQSEQLLQSQQQSDLSEKQQQTQSAQQQQQQQKQQQPEEQQKVSTTTGTNDKSNYQVDQKLLQPQIQLETKSIDEFDEDSNTLSDLRQPKLEYDAERSSSVEQNEKSTEIACVTEDENSWWKDYFERKLQVEREKIELQRNMHQEMLQVSKLTMMQQERIERAKIDAINNLTSTLQKLVEAKNRKI